MSLPRSGAGLSTEISPARAAAEASGEATESFGDDIPNLVACFVSVDYADFADEVASSLAELFPGAAIIGCTADGVIGNAREMESGPAVSVFAAFLPDTIVTPFGVRFQEGDDGEFLYDGWPPNLSPDATVLLLCDRFSFPAGHLLQMLNDERPGTIVMGGIASGGDSAGDTRLILGGHTFTDGAVAIALSGRMRVTPVVSQGCRPIGSPATITRADRNMIFEIAGERPVDRIKEIWRTAEPADRSLMQAGLQIGRVVDEYKTDFRSGDFLIRPVVGADAETGVVAVGEVMAVGETVQFHVRDPQTADEDLRTQLESLRVTPSGALLFTCNGRGTNLFAEPDHDARLLSEILSTPLAGLFCAGELGPIGGRNFLHGQTASVALFVDTAI